MIKWSRVKIVFCKSKRLSLAVIFTFYFLLFTSLSEAQTRAIWVRPFINADQQVRASSENARRHIRAELEQIVRAKFDTVFVETFWDGYTIYPSKFAEQRPLSIAYGTGRAGSENYDVLRIYLEEAAKLKLGVHAWLHVFHQWNTNLGDLSKSPIFKQHPEWAALDQTGSPYVKSEAEGAGRDVYKVFLSPSNRAARDFLKKIVGEITDKYPTLSGVQWDYIRYPLHDGEQSFDYSENAERRFSAASQLDSRNLRTAEERETFQDWKTQQVTNAVEDLSRIVKTKRPAWRVSVAVFPDFQQTLRVKMQDTRDWARRGLIDAIYPMLYAPDYKRVEAWAREFRPAIPEKTKVYATFYVSHFYDKKTGAIDERFLAIPAKYGYDGYGIFAAQLLTEDLIQKLNR